MCAYKSGSFDVNYITTLWLTEILDERHVSWWHLAWRNAFIFTSFHYQWLRASTENLVL